MRILSAITQLRTTDLAGSISFYTMKLGLTLEFQYEDFYAGIRAGTQLFHLKLSDEKDPSIEFVDKGEHFHLYFETDDASAAAAALKTNGVLLAKDVHETAWGRESLSLGTIKGIRCTSVNAGKCADGLQPLLALWLHKRRCNVLARIFAPMEWRHYGYEEGDSKEKRREEGYC